MPSPEIVERAYEKIKLRGVNYRYFFKHITSPDWIDPLKEKGFFVDPPKPVEEEDHIQFPEWPESRYLARVAAQAPELVLRTALEIPNTDNVRVHEDLVNAALAMPPDLASQLASRVEQWIQTPYLLLLPEKVGALISHLVLGGQVEAALRLARELMMVVPGRYVGVDAEDAQKPLWKPDPESRIRSWDYDSFLRNHLPHLSQVAPKETLALLSDLLDSALQLARQRREPDSADYSEVWRPAIEDHPQNTGFGGVKDKLVTAIRDTARHILAAETSLLSDLVTDLEARNWTVFRRIALDLVRQFGDRDPRLVAAKLTDRGLFDNSAMRHEYSHLAKTYFDKLAPGEQDVILGWIEDGPDMAHYSLFVEREEGHRPDEQRLQTYKERWQLRWLANLTGVLPDRWQRVYDALENRYGEPEHPDLVSWSSGVRSGPTSPKSSDEIEAMAVPDLIAFLRTWEPPTGFMEDTPEGLGRALTKAISENPARYAAHSTDFQGMEVTYVRSLVAGLRGALKEGRVFDWGLVLELCSWIVAQPREIPGRSDDNRFDRDPHWGWARTEVARLLEDGFTKRDVAIPFKLRKVAWDVLCPLTSDPDPTPAHEERYGGPNMDPATLSINTTRGVSLHAVIRYAWWCKENEAVQATDGQERLAGFTVTPEASEVLETHLDISLDPSLAVRSIYGRWFWTLAVLDREWTITHKQVIFPREESLVAYWRAAWDAFVQFHQPNNTLGEIIRDEYRFAIRRIANEDERKRAGWLRNPDEALAAHLMTFYWWGEIGLDSDLLRSFWSIASNALRAQAISYIGTGLYNSSEEVPNEVIERLKQLWEARLEIALEAESLEPYSKEVTAFGWWFASGEFDDEWSIKQLGLVLKLRGEVEADHHVVERLADLSTSRPGDSVALLAAMIEGDRKGWGIHLWRDDARRLLKEALQSVDISARQAAETLIHRLGSRGYLEFGDLLTSTA